MDTAGDVAGTYLDSNGIAHGFVRAIDGTIKTYTAPNAGVTGVGSTKEGKGTYFTSMDAAGDIAGYYSDANNLYHGLYLPAGSTTLSYYDVLTATNFGHLGTALTGINAAGVITGFFRDAALVYHGFMRTANGTFTQIDATGAGTGTYQGTEPFSINSAGVITGSFTDANFVHHGFVRAVDGTFSIITPSGADTAPGTVKEQVGTFGLSINDAGVVVGGYGDPSHVFHLFVLATDGTIIPIVTPGDSGGSVCETIPHNLICGSGGLSINTAGDITGTYADSSGIMHGFLRAVDTGNITSFDAPGAGNSGTFQGTGGFAINTAGTIAGTYVDNNVVLHGFIYTPALTATAIALTPAPTPNPSVYGEPVSLTAVVSYSGVAPPNGESVAFLSGTTSLGTTALTTGTASLTTTALPVGQDSLTAVYSGDSDLSGSTSTAVIETVGKASSTAALISSLSPLISGQPVTFTAIVTGQFGGAATGTVAFSNGSASLGTVPLSANQAAITTTALPVGTAAITAVYSGDSNFTASTSNTVSQVVNAPVTPTITWATPATISYGTALGAAQLNATASVAGTFVYSPAAGTVLGAGLQTLSVTFTPTDTIDYTTATATVQLPVSKATPTLAWATPANIPYGTALGATQLNATASVAGTFVYSPAAGTVPGAGPQTLSVTFTPMDTTNYAKATATVPLSVDKATPILTWATPAAVSYGTALSATQLDATASVAGTFVYSPAAGTVPGVGSQPLAVTFTPADTTDYNTATATVELTVNIAANPLPALTGLSPAFISAGGADFTLTINGSGFTTGSTAFWGTTALVTSYVSPTQVTALVPAADTATGGIAVAITAVTPAPGGGTSNSLQFEVDSASGTTTGPVFSSLTETVAAGSTASYPVTLPSSVTSATVTCLNLPAGATCSYSPTANTVSIATTSATPAGTYQITVVCTETVTGAAAAAVLLPILLLPLVFLRKKLAARGMWFTACLGLVLLAGLAFSSGCGGGVSMQQTTTPPQTHSATSAGAVTLTVQ
jgi:hypothetical protein